MPTRDLNLLHTLDAVLSEGSVTRAARRLRLSPSAMSRALSRLRVATGDPLLVKAGRSLVPTPRAVALRERVAQLVSEAEEVLRPTDRIDLANISRLFSIRTRDGFVETFGPPLLARLRAEAPGVRVHFVQKLDRDQSALRDGIVDLETGVIGRDTAAEMRSQPLFTDRLVIVVRRRHPLTRGTVTPVRYAAAEHVSVAPIGRADDPLEASVQVDGVARRVVATVSGFSAALALARTTDVVATVPERHTAGLREGLATLPLPMPVAPIPVSMLWHPRLDADAAHRWLRQLLPQVVTSG